MLLPFTENTSGCVQGGSVCGGASIEVGPDLQERQKLPVPYALGSSVNTSRPLELNAQKPPMITLAFGSRKGFQSWVILQLEGAGVAQEA